MSPAATCTTVPLDRITLDDRAWPREELDEERVELFAELIRDARHEAEAARTGWTDPFPPLVAVADGNGGLLLADGRHRYEARRRLGAGFDLVPVAVYQPNGQALEAYAYELALVCTLAAKPLSNAEKRAAIDRLIAERPELSDRAIARLVGVSPSTVGPHRARVSNLDTAPPDRGENSGAKRIQASSSHREPLRWEVAAEQLADAVAELLQSCQKLFGGPNFKRAGRELYEALADRYGDDDALTVIDELSAVVGNACAHARKTQS